MLDKDSKVLNCKNTDILLAVISSLLITLYLTANTMATKIISFQDITLFDAGTITFPFTFMLGDILTELFGYKTAKKVIFLAFFCNILMVSLTWIGTILPSPPELQVSSDAYNTIFGYTPRIVIASLIAFLLGELVNSWSMEKIKTITHGKYLWVRSIGSSMAGYMFDTVLFTIVAFIGTVSLIDIFSMIVYQYIAKLLIESIFATPLTYLAVRWIRKRYM